MPTKALEIDSALARRRTRPYTGFALAGALLTVIFSQAALAQNLDRVVRFDIRPQTLDKALLEFGQQAHIQVMFASKSSMTRIRTEKLAGSHVAREALAELLRGTGLRYVAHGDTVEVLPKSGTQSDPGKGTRHSPSSGEPREPDHDGRAAHASREAKNDPDSLARDDQGEAPRLQEVLVTAQKYRQRAFDVPISLDVVTGDELRRLNITSLNGLQYGVAGLYVEGGHFNNYIVLRGVSNLAGNGALVGEYIDNADISADGYAGQVGYGTGDVQIYDVKRVEVLKGPQGTLYGDGAMGGVIRYITNKPSTIRSEIGLDVSALFTQYGAPSERSDLMLNAPLIVGKVGIRVAAQLQHDGGWVDEPAANLKNINDFSATDVRIEGLWQAAADVKALLTQIIHRDAYGIGAGEDPQGNITPVYGITSPPHGEQSLNLSNLTVTADFRRAQLLSSSTYLTHAETTYNASYTVPGIVELLSFFPVSNRDFSEELRLHSKGVGRWQWVLGAFYKHYEDFDAGSYYFGPPGPLSSASHEYLAGNTELSTSEAAFADSSFRLFGRMTLGAGLRYFRSRFTATAGNIFLGNVAIIPPNQAHESFTSTDPRFYAMYGVSRHVNVYASVAKGFRSGEPNLGLVKGYDPEDLWSYDLGTKLRLLQGRLKSDEDIFYERYSNYVGQGLITVYGVPTFGNFNIGNAREKGIDADVEWVESMWRIATKGELVSSKFVTIDAADTGYMPGQRLPYVPEYTFNGFIERQFLWSDRPSFMQLSYSQTGAVQHGSPATSSDVIHFLNFKSGVKWNRNLEISFYVQNLLNDRGYLDPNWNEAAAYRPRPRTFGFDFRLSLQ